MLAPIGLGDPRELIEERRAPFMAFCSRGLCGDANPARLPFPFSPIELPKLEAELRGELEKLRLLPADPEIEGVRE